MSKNFAEFSVVLPLYNKERYVARALSSVLSQSHDRFEVVVVDDGSTDRSVAIVRTLTQGDPRVRIIEQINGGPGAARNTGIQAAKFEWIALLDADDAWRVDHLQELNELIQECPTARVVTTRLRQADTRSNAHVNVPADIEPACRRLVDYFSEAARRPDFIHSSSVAIARVVFNKIGLFATYARGEDQELWARACLEFSCAASSAETAFYYRGTGGIMETAWTSLSNKANHRKPPSSLVDLTRATAFLAARLDTIAREKPSAYASVVEYVNSRVTISLRVHLYSGRVDDVARIAGLYLRPFDRRTQAWRLIALGAPSPALSGVYMARQCVKSVYLNSRSALRKMIAVTQQSP